MRLSRTDMRPPCSALASMGSTGGRVNSRRDRAASTAMSTPPTTGTSASQGEARLTCPLSRSFKGIWKRMLWRVVRHPAHGRDDSTRKHAGKSCEPRSQTSRNRRAFPGGLIHIRMLSERALTPEAPRHASSCAPPISAPPPQATPERIFPFTGKVTQASFQQSHTSQNKRVAIGCAKE